MKIVHCIVFIVPETERVLLQHRQQNQILANSYYCQALT